MNGRSTSAKYACGRTLLERRGLLRRGRVESANPAVPADSGHKLSKSRIPWTIQSDSLPEGKWRRDSPSSARGRSFKPCTHDTLVNWTGKQRRMSQPERPKIYHIVHVDRLASIARNGCLLSDAVMSVHQGTGTTIGMSRIKQRRLALPVAIDPFCRLMIEVGTRS